LRSIKRQQKNNNADTKQQPKQNQLLVKLLRIKIKKVRGENIYAGVDKKNKL
jgi:hypothetical protein